MSLNSEWFQSYDKTIANISISLFIRFCTKNRLSQFLYFYVLCHYFCTNQDLEAPQNDHLNLRFVNDKHVVCKKYTDMHCKPIPHNDYRDFPVSQFYPVMTQ